MYLPSVAMLVLLIDIDDIVCIRCGSPFSDNRTFNLIHFKNRAKGSEILDRISENRTELTSAYEKCLERFKESYDLIKLKRNLGLLKKPIDKLYNLYNLEPIAFIILHQEFDQLIVNLQSIFENKLIEVLKISSMCILDASPKSKMKRIFLLLRAQDLVSELLAFLHDYNIKYNTEHLDQIFKSIIDKDGLDSNYWSIVHYKAVKKGLVMLGKALILSLINKIIIPILLNSLVSMLPKDSLLTFIAKNVNFNLINKVN